MTTALLDRLTGAVHESIREMQIAMRTAGAQEIATPRGWGSELTVINSRLAASHRL
jgi:hypothetical protein